MTHTPGPWQVHQSHIYTADPERALICQVWNPGRKESDFPIVANARLIAAAPDLLDAAQRLIALHDLIVGSVSDRDLAPLDEALARMEAAIAKATGGQ